MAVTQLKEKDVLLRYRREYVADAERDIEGLPTADPPGSTCYCCDNGTTYILTPSHRWVVRKNSTNNKQEAEEDIEDIFRQYATMEDIDSIFEDATTSPTDTVKGDIDYIFSF